MQVTVVKILTGVVLQLRIQQRDGELRELLITGLASLVSANTECGVKHALTLANDPDPTKRLVFAHVFIRVLKEGIQFTSYDEPPVVVKQSRLCEVSDSGLKALTVAHVLCSSSKALM